MHTFKFKRKRGRSPSADVRSDDHITAHTSTTSTDKGQPSKTGDEISHGLGYIIKPFFSEEHRTAITQQCIAKALSTMMEDKNDSEEVTVREEVSPIKHKYDWSRALHTELRWNRLFLLFTVHLERTAPHAFAQLRSRDFGISPEIYGRFFTGPLVPLSNLGLSGSAFFHTATIPALDTAGLIVKSINRPFEYEFLHTTLLPEYIAYFDKMNDEKRGDSLLTRITDVIYSSDATLGGMLRLSPRHYMVMVDILGDLKAIEGAKKWDLKPMFFEPTRDLVPDTLKSEATKSGLADKLDDDVRIRLTRRQYSSLMRFLRKDTEFLQNLGIVDYSLLFGRWPSAAKGQIPPPLGLENRPFLLSREVASKFKTVINAVTHQHDDNTDKDEGDFHDGCDFVRGVESADGKWIYRLTVVDFLWNVTKLVPTVMRTAGKAALLPDQTITAEPETYRTAFLEMVQEYVEVSTE